MDILEDCDISEFEGEGDHERGMDEPNTENGHAIVYSITHVISFIMMYNEP